MTDAVVAEQRSASGIPALTSRLRRLADARTADAAVAAMILVACLGLFYLARLSTFRGDDWVFATARRPLAWDYLLQPHNEHWSVGMKGIFQAIFAVVGLRSYLPYLAALLAAYGLAVWFVYKVVVSAGGRLLGVAVVVVMLVMGDAHEDLFWYAGIAFLISIASGAAAIWLAISRPASRRLALGVLALLVFSVANSGMGLAFTAGCAAALLLRPGARSTAWAPFAALGVFIVWDRIWGAPTPITVESLGSAAGFMVVGATRGVAALTGLPDAVATPILLVMIGAVWLPLARGLRPSPAAAAGAATLIGFLGVTALARDAGGGGVYMSLAPRYITLTAAALAICAAGLLGMPSDRRSALLRAVALAPLVVSACLVNVPALFDASTVYANEATDLRAMLTVLARYPDAPAVIASHPLGTPSASLARLLAEHGSPVTDTLRPSVVLPIDEGALDRGLYALVGDQLTVDPAAGQPAGSTPLQGSGYYQVSRTQTGSCITVQSLGPDGQIALALGSGDAITLTAPHAGRLSLYLAHFAAQFQVASSREADVSAGATYRITTPDMGSGFAWRLNLKLGSDLGEATVCPG